MPETQPHDMAVWTVFCEEPSLSMPQLAERVSAHLGRPVSRHDASASLTRIFRIEMGADRHDALMGAYYTDETED